MKVCLALLLVTLLCLETSGFFFGKKHSSHKPRYYKVYRYHVPYYRYSRPVFYHHPRRFYYSVATHHPPMNVAPKMEPQKDIVEVAQEAGSFNSLIDFVQAQGQTEYLKNDECKTVLAPPDEAFNNLPPGALDNLLGKEEGTTVLVKHVIPGCKKSGDLQPGPIETAGGEVINFLKQADGKLQIESNSKIYNITATDIEARNGVIHVVDGIFV